MTLTTKSYHENIELHSICVGEGPSLVLLHGWGLSSWVWANTVEQLKPFFKITLIDLPGYGGSTDLLNSNDLNCMLTAIAKCIPDNSTLLGWSLGGLIAIYLAYYYPKKISQLILLASSPYFMKTDSWPGMHSAVMLRFHQQLNEDYYKTMQRFIFLQFYDCPEEKFLSKQMIENLKSEPRPTQMALERGLYLLQQCDARQLFSKLNCPILGLYGRLDSLVPVEVVSSIKQLNNKIITYLFSNAAHAPFISHFELFIHKVKQFLGSQNAK